MTECNAEICEKSSPQLNFPFVKSKRISVDFEGGEITSDAGWVLLRRVDERERLCEKISEAIVDRFYRERGEGAENRIKEWKTMMHADRLSCHKFYANWLRLLLYSAAYILMWSLKQNLEGTELERSTVETIRLKIIKLGARIRSAARRLWVHCASGYPYKNIWIHLHAQLAPV